MREKDRTIYSALDRNQFSAPPRHRPLTAAIALACVICAIIFLIVAMMFPVLSRAMAAMELALMLAACAIMLAAWRQTSSLRGDLAASDAMLNAVFLATPALTLTRDGIISRLNAAALTLFNITDSAARGRPFSELVLGFDMAAIHALGTPSGVLDPETGYWIGHRPDGTTFPLSMHFTLPPDGSVRDHVALGIADLTLRHAAETQARELHTQLNTVWRLNSLGEMAATLAHELNQPLSAAISYLHAGRAEMEQAGSEGHNTCKTLDLAQAQLLRAGSILRRIRDFLTLETGAMGDESATDMIDNMKSILTRIGQDKKVAIHIDMIADDDLVQADRLQFQQAVVNLVRNGVEAATGREDALVQIRGRVVADGYHISVEDNGPGLRMEQGERLFKPMVSTKPGGMGLGLSVTRTIIERHGGILAASQSDALGGAAFFFTLPRNPEILLA